MYLMIFYSFFLLLGGLGWGGAALYTYYTFQDYIIEWVLIGGGGVMVEVFILLDWVGGLFISFVMIISSSVILYSGVYMGKDKNLKRFLYLVMAFIFSMVMVIISPSMLSILFGWDMLGLISYCLIIYFQSREGLNSGMVTVLMNRVGDVGVLMCIGLLLSHGSWNYFMMWEGPEHVLLVSMMLLAGVTKSAQMPFSSWLPLAMAAPTPVSALVHSSTLVTAGVYLILRFNECMNSVKGGLLFIAVGTMLMSGVMAMLECDLKKVIALSTLSQLGFMMMILSGGLKMLGFFHLLTHAVFKSLLFLCAGVIIHSCKDNQDIRGYGNMSSVLPFVSLSFYISVMALAGFPFLAGFYSKDLIMESLYIMEVNVLMMMFIFISLGFTVLYSLRLCFYLYFGSMKMWFNEIMENKVMNFSLLSLLGLSVGAGSLLSWLFFWEQEVIILSGGAKVFVLMILSSSGLLFLTGGWWGVVAWPPGGGLSPLGGGVVFFFSKMWLLNFLHLSLSGGGLLAVKSGSGSEWVETVSSKMIFIVKFLIMKLYFMEFKTYKLIMSQGGLVLILFIYLML